jgi:hypothetical protein
MLRDERCGGDNDRPCSGAYRCLAALALVALTMGVATLRGPALRAADAPPAAPVTVDAAAPLELRYVPQGMDGVVVVRPAALLRHKEMERLARIVTDELFPILFEPGPPPQFKAAAGGPLKLGLEEIESVVTGIRVSGRDDKEPAMPRLMLGGVVTIRTCAPFDWLTYLRQWGVGFEEVREDGRVFHKATGSPQFWGPNVCLYFHDRRTLVVGELSTVRAMAARPEPTTPAYLRGPDWERAGGGVIAVAIDNHDGSFPRRYDLGRPDDALFLSLFPGVDHWVISADDADPIVLHAAAACRGREASDAIVRTIETLRSVGQKALKQLEADPDDVDAPDTIAIRMAEALLAQLRVEAIGGTVRLRASGFGTLADLVAFIEGEQKAQAEAARASATTAQ